MKDVEYIFKIREMEGMQCNKSRDHVPSMYWRRGEREGRERGERGEREGRERGERGEREGSEGSEGSERGVRGVRRVGREGEEKGSGTNVIKQYRG